MQRGDPPRISGQASGRMKRLSMSGTGFDTGIEGVDATFEPAVGDFIELMKPRVMSLVVFTALVGMVAAPGELHPVLAGIALLCHRRRRRRLGRPQHVVRRRHRRAHGAHGGATHSARPRDADEALTFGIVLAIGSVMTLGVLVNWVAGALLALTIALLRLRLHDVAEAPHAAEHRHRRRRRRLPAHDRLGGGDGSVSARERRPVPDHLHVDAAALLGAGALSLRATTSAPACRCCRWSRPGETRRQILIYSVLLVPLAVVPALHRSSAAWPMRAASVGLGAIFLALAINVWRRPRVREADSVARQLFQFDASTCSYCLRFYWWSMLR